MYVEPCITLEVNAVFRILELCFIAMLRDIEVL